jgi:hypothetical protein
LGARRDAASELSVVRGLLTSRGKEERAMALTVTLSELITAVADCAQSENEVVATVIHMINSGQVRLRGSFSGAQVDFPASRAPQPA